MPTPARAARPRPAPTHDEQLRPPPRPAPWPGARFRSASARSRYARVTDHPRRRPPGEICAADHATGEDAPMGLARQCALRRRSAAPGNASTAAATAKKNGAAPARRPGQRVHFGMPLTGLWKNTGNRAPGDPGLRPRRPARRFRLRVSQGQSMQRWQDQTPTACAAVVTATRTMSRNCAKRPMATNERHQTPRRRQSRTTGLATKHRI